MIRQNRTIKLGWTLSSGNLNDNIREDLAPFRNRAGWILVGGRSSRMGIDKALLEISGTPLVLRIAMEVGKVCDTVSLVGDPAKYGRLGLPVLADAFPGEGPLGGIEAALRSTTADWNLVTACDMPALDILVLESLFCGVGDGALPRYENGDVEPLCAVYHRRCHAAIHKAFESGIRKVLDALSTLELTYIPVATNAPFVNLNTPGDLRKYKNG